MINVLFIGNKASNGGAMYNVGDKTSPTLTNVTFSGNRASRDGGAIYNLGLDNMIVSNSIFWNNLDSSGSGTISSTIVNYDANITLVCSLVQGTGGSQNWIQDNRFINGGCNIDQNPRFITPVSPNSAPTSDGNFRLMSSSPAVESGNNNAVTVSTDLDGNTRIMDGDSDGDPIVDIGAYEFQLEYPYDTFIPINFH